MSHFAQTAASGNGTTYETNHGTVYICGWKSGISWPAIQRITSKN